MRVLGGALLFAAAAAVGAGIASRMAPRELHEAVEAALSRALGAPVRVASARLLVSHPRVFGIPDLAIQAEGLEAYGEGEAAALRAERIDAPLDPVSLLSGRIRFASLGLDRVRLALVRERDGRFEPPLLSPGLESPAVVLGRLFATGLPAPMIEVRSGSLLVVDRAAQVAGAPARYEAEDLEILLRERRWLEPGRLVVSGRLRNPGRPPARFSIESVASDDGLPSFELAATDFPLDRLRPASEALAAGLSVEGVVSGTLGLSHPADAATALALDVRVEGARFETPDSEPIRIGSVGFDGTLRLESGATRIEPGATLRADGLDLAIEAELRGGIRPDVTLRFAVSLGVLEERGLATLGAWLPSRARGGLDRAGRSLSRGRLADVSLSGNATLERIEEVFEGGGGLLPEGVTLAARIEDLVLEPEIDDPVVASSGFARLSGPDTLEVSGLEGRVGETALPRLELRFEGISHLLRAASAPVPEVSPLPGLHVLQELLAPDQSEESSLHWSSLELEADWLLHPVFFRPVHELRARLAPIAGGVRIERAEGTFGGVPIRVTGLIETGTPGRAELEVHASEASLREAATSAGAVARGRFRIERPPAPGLALRAIGAGFDVSGTRLLLFDARGETDAPGRTGGDARLDLGRNDAVPAEIHVELSQARVSDVLALLSDDPVEASGALDLSARLRGELRPGVDPLRSLDGTIHVNAAHGELGIELPVLLAIAKASTTFNPFGSARGIRFEEIDAELSLEGGLLSTQRSITLESPDLRLALSGEIDLRETPSRLEAVVGCFFLRPLDQLIGWIPVVSRIVLGPDRSLFGTWFELRGSWESPTAGLIPAKTVALGPATFLIEDVPAFVRRGILAVQEALSGPAPSPPAVASPAAGAVLPGGGS